MCACMYVCSANLYSYVTAWRVYIVSMHIIYITVYIYMDVFCTKLSKKTNLLPLLSIRSKLTDSIYDQRRSVCDYHVLLREIWLLLFAAQVTEYLKGEVILLLLGFKVLCDHVCCDAPVGPLLAI